MIYTKKDKDAYFAFAEKYGNAITITTNKRPNNDIDVAPITNLADLTSGMERYIWIGVLLYIQMNNNNMVGKSMSNIFLL